MGIEIRQKGEAELKARTAKAISRQRDTQKAEAQAARREEMLLDIEARRKADAASRDWELQKMLLNSQQAFQHEMRMKQTQLDRDARSEEWELEKAEITSRMDFEKEEMERQRVIDNATNALTAIEKGEKEGKWGGGGEDDKDLEKIKLYYQLQKMAGKAPPTSLLPRETKAPSARSQASEIEAGFELEGYTPDDLRELGLDPKDFPGVSGEETGQYTVGQVVNTPQGNMVVIGFDDDGEPLVEPEGITAAQKTFTPPNKPLTPPTPVEAKTEKSGWRGFGDRYRKSVLR